MATKKSTPTDEKFEAQDFNLFDALAAMDKKDYDYYDRLTEEQQKKFVPYMMTHWMSAIKGSVKDSKYYVLSTNEYANKHLFNEHVQKHPKLQWLMLCCSSPDKGKQFHKWIPHLGSKVTSLKESAKVKEIKEYYTKIYPKADSDSIDEISKQFVIEHKRKCYLAETFPNLKQSDIEVLSQLVTDEDIKQYEKDRGN
jgi:hypothetical protein